MTGIYKIPIMRIRDNLLVSIQVDMIDEMAVHLQTDILEQLVATYTNGVLLDISALDMIDSFLARKFSEIARLAAIMDAAVVIVGMQPAVALTLVELGLDLKEVHYALNMDYGMEFLDAMKHNSPEV